MARPRSVDDEAILDATRVVLGQEGPSGLTLAAVGRQVGLAPATLIQRFGSKRGLLLASAARSPEMVRRAYAESEARATSPLAALYDVATSSVAHIVKREEIGNGLGFVQLDVGDPDFRVHALAHSQAIEDGSARFLHAAREAGELVDDVDVAALARTVLVTFQGALIIWAIHGGGTLSDFVREQLDRILNPYLP
ncbi:hypothetical protein VV02_06430 [Luteipulveratus mongoliensis]|uniref:HTH tetR-type domain-containing protein n=2 Tax=Luteipulveratus mongoliensis TaxID=571913 RepID=A0A0K1JG55_9MICO|nr:hypothetical protein VV02_06430 [Luteipulveratus mongoliensis]